ncbi:hypothetical protein C8R45DRAFT_1105101 [Mycena sanguinolenta]|nr:hypothetical protein C8R45DRAFT_1105101 [Mycena sanguinolenta]
MCPYVSNHSLSRPRTVLTRTTSSKSIASTSSKDQDFDCGATTNISLSTIFLILVPQLVPVFLFLSLAFTFPVSPLFPPSRAASLPSPKKGSRVDTSLGSSSPHQVCSHLSPEAPWVITKLLFLSILSLPGLVVQLFLGPIGALLSRGDKVYTPFFRLRREKILLSWWLLCEGTFDRYTQARGSQI